MKAHYSLVADRSHGASAPLPNLPKVPGLGMAAAIAVNVGLWGAIATLMTLLAR